MDLQSHVTKSALENGAILVGYTKVRKVAPVMVLAFPFPDKSFLKYPFYINKRFGEEIVSSWKLQDKISNLLKKEGYTAKKKSTLSVYGDFRPLAISAGLGQWGKNGLVVNKEHGSKLLFAAIFTNAPFDADTRSCEEINTNNPCLTCNACTRSCPADAFANQLFNAKRCLPFSIKGCAECVRSCKGGKTFH